MKTINFLSHQSIIDKINSFKGNVVVFGYSNTTKMFLKDITNNKVLIIDNNSNLDGSKDEEYGVCIKSINALDLLENYIVIVWGNYCKENVEQLFNFGICDVFVDLDYGGYKLKNIRFIIEVPPYSIHKKTPLGAQHKFILNFMKQLTLMQIPFEVIPINQININKRYNPKQGEVVISYHTKGKKNKNLFRYKESYLNEYVTFDTKGFSGWHSMCDEEIDRELKKLDVSMVQKFYDKIYTKYILGNVSKYAQKIVDFDFPQKYIFFAMQVSTDVVSELSSMSQGNVLDCLVNQFNGSNIKIIVKKHPKCNDIRFNSKLEYLAKDNKILLYDGSIHDAIQGSDAVIVSNSGVGFEALLHLKPVFSFGKSEYSFLTYNLGSLEMLKDNSFGAIQKDDLYVKRFIYYYLNIVCMGSNNMAKITNCINMIVEKLEFK